MNNLKSYEQMGYQPRKIYHYCSLEALYGIVTSKSLWLTSLDSTNDKKELRLVYDIFEQALDQIIDTEENLDLKNDFTYLREIAYKNRKNKYRKEQNYYGISFINKRDNLTHWDRYGNGSKGVCIEFNALGFKQLFLERQVPEYFTSWVSQCEVIYNKEDQIRSTINEIKGKYNKFSQNFDKIFENREKRVGAVYISAISSLKPKFKDIGFIDENEERIYFDSYEMNLLLRLFKTELNQNFKSVAIELEKHIKRLGLSSKHHSLFNGLIRGYYPLNLETIWSKDFIPEIIIGPKCYQNKAELISFLTSNGLKGTKVSVSKVPLR